MKYPWPVYARRAPTNLPAQCWFRVTMKILTGAVRLAQTRQSAMLHSTGVGCWACVWLCFGVCVCVCMWVCMCVHAHQKECPQTVCVCAREYVRPRTSKIVSQNSLSVVSNNSMHARISTHHTHNTHTNLRMRAQREREREREREKVGALSPVNNRGILQG